jgi:hypothetical protein
MISSILIPRIICRVFPVILSRVLTQRKDAGHSNLRSILLGLFVALTIIFAFATVAKSGRTTVTETLSTMQTTTVTGSNNTGAVFKVTFQQEGACSPTLYVPKWSVVLGNENETEQLSSHDYYAGPIPVPDLVFSVPNGFYQYRITGDGVGYAFEPDSGNVTVDGADVVVVAVGPMTSCTAVATSSAATSTVTQALCCTTSYSVQGSSTQPAESTSQQGVEIETALLVRLGRPNLGVRSHVRAPILDFKASSGVGWTC